MQTGSQPLPALAVVIVGAPRSGTYWVVDLLQTRLRIHIPTETHFYPLFRKYLWLWGDLSRPENRRRLLKNIYEFIAAWTVRSSVSEDYRARVRALSLLVTIDEGCVEDIVEESWDYPSLAEAMYRHFARVHGAVASGDKSAHYRVMQPEKLFDEFPEAKMLHVVRDGRDVALSWVKEWFGPPGMTEAARKWAEHIEVNRAWGRRHPRRYLELRYEDIARDCEGQIKRLETFLGVSALPDTGQGSVLADVLSTSPSHEGIKSIVAAENIAKWKHQVTKDDIAAFESIAGGALADCGYELVAEPGEVVAATRRPALSVHALRVLAKTFLPLVLGICGRLRIPLLGIINRAYPVEWREVKL